MHPLMCLCRYSAASAETRVIFARYDPDFSAGSLDEAALDVTDICGARGITPAQVGASYYGSEYLVTAGECVLCRLLLSLHRSLSFCQHGPACDAQHAALLMAAAWVPWLQVAEEMRAAVLAETRLTCSCGFAPNRMLAKVRD
jgi:nucleotidyltransferase/DNA polymerase involved in DNA repair